MQYQFPSPCFVLEVAKLEANLKQLAAIKAATGCTIICALKGFALYPAFELVTQYLDGGTASSLHEAMLIDQHMGRKAHTYAPAYRDDEFAAITSLSSHITFNSLNQWQRYQQQVPGHVSCGLRINPQYSEVSTDLYNPCVPGSRLGIVASQLGPTLPDGIEGLHFHTLCENDSYTLERTLQHVEQRFGPLLHQAKWLNMGGGHLITRKGYDASHLTGLIQHLQSTYNLEVILEPGSAIGWETGFLLSTVLDIIDSQGIQVAMLDVSVANHMPDCLEMPYTPRITGATIVGGADTPPTQRHVYRMGGLTCLAGDFVGDYAFDAPLTIGQQVVFEDMMHYTMVKTTTFNGVNLPAIGLLGKDGTARVLKTFGYESYVDRLG